MIIRQRILSKNSVFALSIIALIGLICVFGLTLIINILSIPGCSDCAATKEYNPLSISRAWSVIRYVSLSVMGNSMADKLPEHYFSGVSLLAAKAIESGDEKILRHLLEGKQLVPQPASNPAMTLLYWAKGHGRLAQAELLLQHGFDPNERFDYSGGTAMLLGLVADRENNKPWVELLLRHNADPNGDDRGSTALEQSSDLTTVRLLLSHGAMKNPAGSAIMRTLQNAALSNHWSIVLELLHRGASLHSGSPTAFYLWQEINESQLKENGFEDLYRTQQEVRAWLNEHHITPPARRPESPADGKDDF